MITYAGPLGGDASLIDAAYAGPLGGDASLIDAAHAGPLGGDASLIDPAHAGPLGGDASLIDPAHAGPLGGDAAGLDLLDLSRRLQQAGWDAFASDLAGQVAARQDQRRDRAVWALVIDHSGRWRCTITRPVGVATARELPAGGQVAHLLDETRQITTITGTLRQAADLPELLAGLEVTA